MTDVHTYFYIIVFGYNVIYIQEKISRYIHGQWIKFTISVQGQCAHFIPTTKRTIICQKQK